MNRMRSNGADGRRRQAGIAMITVLVSLVALIGASALAIDGGMLWTARTQVQNAADAAALAAGRSLIDPVTPAVTLAAAEAAAISQASQNEAVSTSSVTVLATDIRYGDWDLTSRSLDTSVDLTDPEQVTGVEVRTRLDTSTTGPVPAFMSRVLGHTSFDVSAIATAYLGYAGSLAPGVVDLPIAIDCCKLKGANCEQDYCSTVSSNPPNACALENPQLTGATTVSCLEFHNTAEQNACWTNFDGNSPGVNTSDLIDIVEDANPVEISIDDPIFLDNGDKVPVIGEIENRFLGQGGYPIPAGTDRYANPPGQPPQADSWVVVLPVVECQTEDHCASGDPMRVVGGVCFEIREITVVPDKIIRGRFLCKEDPLFDECDLGLTKSGGLDFGTRADIPVLVR